MNVLQRIVHYLSRSLAHKLVDKYLNVSIEYLSGTRLPHKGEAAILVFNHSNETESVLTPGYITKVPIQMWAKDTLWRNPFLGLYLSAGGMIKVRGASSPKAMIYSIKVLTRKLRFWMIRSWIGIFVEGGRTDGKAIYKARVGAAKLAYATGATIFVIPIKGTDALHLKDRSTWQTPITYTVARLIPVKKVDNPSKEQLEALSREITSTLSDTLGLPYVDEYYRKRGGIGCEVL